MNRNISLITFIVFAFVLVLPVNALPADGIPQTQEEIHEYAEEILKDEIINYCSAVYLNEDVTHLSAEELSIAVENYPEYPRRILDTLNSTITIVQPLNRIVAYNYHAIWVLKAEDQVIGIANSAMEDACIIPDLYTKENIGGGGPYEPDFEKILSLRPDALLTYTRLGPGSEFFEQRMPEGVPVIRMDFIRPWSRITEMKKLGYLLDRTAESSAYVEWHDRYMDEIDRRLATIPTDERLRVFVDVWSNSFQGSGNERRTVSNDEEYSYFCINGGGINVAGDLSNPQGTVDIEWLAQQNPDAILGIAYDGSYSSDDINELKAQYDELMNHPALQEVPAIKNNRVYVLSFHYVNYLTYPAARAQIVKWFYPDLFADMDPTQIHKDFLKVFLNSSFDIDQHGVFNYPK